MACKALSMVVLVGCLFLSGEASLTRCGPRLLVFMSLYSDRERDSFLDGIIWERKGAC